MNRRQWTWAWGALILVLCSVPGRELPDVDLLGADKAVHFSMFFVLALLAAWPPAAYARLPLVAIGTLFGFATEVYQWVMPIGRSFDPYDVTANVIGLLAGMTMCFFRARIRTPPSETF